jgi:hypothetical protein
MAVNERELETAFIISPPISENSQNCNMRSQICDDFITLIDDPTQKGPGPDPQTPHNMKTRVELILVKRRSKRESHNKNSTMIISKQHSFGVDDPKTVELFSKMREKWFKLH